MSGWPALGFHGLARAGARAFGGRYGEVPRPVLPPESFEVAVTGGRLAGLRWAAGGGQGPPLLLLHGLNQNAWVWARCGSLLAAGREVIALTLPGHGHSSPPPEGYALEATARAVDEAAGALGLGPVDLGGHSWGGKVATVLAARHPGRLRRLVLADPALPQGLGPVLQAAPSLVDLAFAPERGPFADEAAWLAAARQVAHLGVTGALDPADLALWTENFRVESGGVRVHRLDEVGFRAILEQALHADVRALLPAVRCPALVLQPTFTLAFWPGALGPLRGLPWVRILRLWGDHTFIHTNPYDAAAAIDGFLGEVDA